MQAPLCLGIDIGGSKIAAGLVTREGIVVARAQSPTPAREGGERIIAVALDLASGLIAGQPVEVIGVGSAGIIDQQTRRVLAATDLLTDWVGTEIGASIEQGVADGTGPIIPVTVVNDVHAQAAGEAWVGAGAGQGTVLLVAVGTGLGGAIVQDGVPLVGGHGASGHVGHIPCAQAESIPCSCGRVGHLEAIASGYGLLRLYRSLGGDPDVLDARAICARAEEDAAAHDAVITSASALGQGVGGMINSIDPDVVIISGGVSLAGELWWHALRAGLRETTLPFLDRVTVVSATLGGDAAIVGAAKIAFDAREVGA